MAVESNSKKVEYEFVVRLSEDQICLICTEVLCVPHLINCCEKQFCRECLVNWLKEKGTCPNCRSTNHSHMLMKETSRKINKLNVYCPNKRNGCQTILRKDELDNHLSDDDGCLFVKVDCPKSCTIKVLRGDLEKHINQMCPKRIVSCPHCATQGEHEDIYGSHLLTSCKLCPVACPNECGAKVPREHLQSHRDTCPLEKVRCLYYEVGCKVICRCELEEHAKSSIADHLALLAKSHLSMKEEHKKTCLAIRQEHEKKCQAIGEVMRALPKNIRDIMQIAQIQTLLSDSSDAEVDKPLYLTLSESNMKSGQHRIKVDESIYKLQWIFLSDQNKYRFTLLDENLVWNHILRISIFPYNPKISTFPYNMKKRDFIQLDGARTTDTIEYTRKENSGLEIEIIFSHNRNE